MPRPVYRSIQSVMRRPTLWAALVIALAVAAAYANTLDVPFQFDDVNAVVDNPTIKQLWPLSGPLTPPDNGSGVHGRPLINLSLAINYAISGDDPTSYHIVNAVLHIFSAWLLMGIVRRSWLRTPRGPGAARPPAAGDRTALAAGFVVALLWSVHPLLTESVTCVIQRTELIVSLFYLLTLYLFVRGLDSPRSHRWFIGSVLSCCAGMASKEVMVTAPVIVWFYDRAFAAGSWREAWRKRWGVHVGLAATWLLLALLMFPSPQRGGTVGFGLGVSSWSYLLTQCYAITLYLKLALWPHPLVVDYGTGIVTGLGAVWPQGLLLVLLASATLGALVRRPRLGFVGFWFFGILAPSSSFVPLASQTIAEHRMYLPLAAVIVLVVAVARRWLTARTMLASAGPIALVAAVATFQRNTVYHTEESLWRDTLAKRPDNARAYNNVGRAYYHQGAWNEAIALYQESLRLDNRVAQTHFNLGLALMRADRLPEAEAAFTDCVRVAPNYFPARLNLGTLLAKLGRAREALPHLSAAVQLDPTSAEAHFQLGAALGKLERWPDAAAQYAQAVELDPKQTEALSNWGSALVAMQAVPAAIERFTAALRLDPKSADIHFNLGLAYAAIGRPDDALAQYREAVRLNPGHVDARLNLGIALGQKGDLAGAIANLESATQLQPDSVKAHTNLGVALTEAGRTGEALAAYEAALRLAPDDPHAQYNVGYALLESHRLDEAKKHFESAVRLDPTFTLASEMLRRLQADVAAP